MTLTSAASLLTQVRTELAYYLTRFPEESPRTASLAHFLATPNQPLIARTNMQGHLTASALILTPDNSKTLLIHHKRLNKWLQPGGHLEPNETPTAAAAREAQEELGLPSISLHPWQITHHYPLDIDTHTIPASSARNESEHPHHDFLYLFQLEEAAPLNIERTEILNTQWLPLQQLASLPSTRFQLLAKKITRSFTSS